MVLKNNKLARIAKLTLSTSFAIAGMIPSSQASISTYTENTASPVESRFGSVGLDSSSFLYKSNSRGTAATTFEADIHGMTVSEAKKALEQLLNTADSTIKEIDVIHGYSNGQALQNMVRKDLKHKRIAAKILSLNQGITTLKLNAK